MTYGTDYASYNAYTWTNNTGRNITFDYYFCGGWNNTVWEDVYVWLYIDDPSGSRTQIAYALNNSITGTVTCKAGQTIRLRVEDNALCTAATFTEQ